MRNRLPFRCPVCGADLGSATTCVRCRTEGRDAAGNAPARRQVPRRAVQGWWTWWLVLVPTVGIVIVLQARASAVLSPWTLGASIAGAVLTSFALTFLARWRSTEAWLRERSERSQAERRRERGGVLRAIVDADGGDLVRVRGRVRTIRPVPTPKGELVAAFRARRVETVGDRGRLEVVETTACGRLAVDDGSGVAIVDDDAFTLEPLDVATAAEVVALRDGDLVEIVGPATRVPAPADIPGGGPGPEQTALVFDGRPEALVLLVPLPLQASMAPPRSHAYGAATQPGPQTLEHDALGQSEAGGRADAEAHGPITGPDR